MATSRAQRIGIWVIATVLTVGTIGSFIVIILSTQNQKSDQARLNELMAAYQVESTEYQKKADAQAAELSKQYYAEFNQYTTRPAVFDKASVSELQTEDLKGGDGEEIKADSSFTAYYIGWNPEGKVFDSSIDGAALKAPISVTPGGVITGWTEGLAGMKTGGVRLLTIPADKAYGEQGSGADIPANTPLKFIVMVIPKPATIAQPQPSDELLRLYSQSAS